MATYYWVGGSGTWNNTTTTNWSLISGGVGGFGPPTSSDDVIFNSGSGTSPTVTIGTNATCNNITISAPTSGTLTFAFGTGGAINLNGNWTSPASNFTTTGTGGAGINFTGSGSSTFTCPSTLSTNMSINGSGTLTLGNVLNIGAGTFTLTQGTFNTSASNYSVACSSFITSGTNAKTLTLNGSTFTVSSSAGFNLAGGSNLTVNAGTSQINLSSGSSPSLNANGFTLYNVSFTSTLTACLPSIAGSGTYNNLTFAACATAGVSFISIASTQVINGTFTVSAPTNPYQRKFIRSSVLNSPVSIVAAAVSLTDVDFQDVSASGAATWSGTRLGNCKGNTGITFTTAKNVYWNSPTGGNWTSTSWALSSGGTPASGNFPLAQDTCIIPSGLNSGVTITINGSFNIGTIDFSSLGATSITLATSANNPTIYGNFVGSYFVALSGTGTITFGGRSLQTILTGGSNFTQAITIASQGGIVRHLDAFTSLTTAVSSLNYGTWDLNGYSINLGGNFSTNNSNTRGISFGGSNLQIGTKTTSGTVWDATTSTNLTLSGGGTITINYAASSTNKTFAGGGYQNYPALVLGANGLTYGTTITGNNAFASFSATGTGNGSGFVKFSGGSTNRFGSFSMNAGATAGQTVTLTSTNTTTLALQKYSPWYVGANSTDNGHNSTLYFASDGTMNYLIVSYINGQQLLLPATSNFLMFF